MDHKYTFDEHMLRMISSELYFLASLHCAREMFGKSYFALGTIEKVAADQALEHILAANFHRQVVQMFDTPQPGQAPLGFAAPAEAR